jgi:hypothetical protein
MSESQWDNKLRAFLKKTGEDLKRAGTDIKSEAERLMAEAKEPGREEKVREGLKTFSKWARKTAEEVAGIVETGVKKAETAVRTVVDTKAPGGSTGAPASATTEPRPTAPEAMRHDTPVDTPAAAAAEAPAGKKSIGKKKGGGSRAKSASGAKKPLGKKR